LITIGKLPTYLEWLGAIKSPPALSPADESHSPLVDAFLASANIESPTGILMEKEN
jgi:hypothetical protein